jgi:cell division protein FtsA
MAKERLITGLDIGSANTRLLVVNQESEEGGLDLFLKDEENSDGVRKGTVVNIDKTSIVIRNILLRNSQELGRKINSAYVNLSGSHLFSIPSSGLVSVSRADQKISEEDIQRVLQNAKTIHLSSNKEIFDTLPIEFIIDEVKGIKDPLGLQGVRLEVNVLALGGFYPYLQNIKQAVLNSDLEILDMIPSSIAAARAVLTEKQKELGVAVLDIGAGISSLAVFEEGNLIHMAVFPMGSANITNDIAIGLKTDIDIAERIKIEFGSCSLIGRDVKRKVKVGEDEPLVFSQKFLMKIIAVRVSEIFEEVNKELKKISKDKLLPAGIVLTGGGAKLPKIVGLAKDKFHLPVRLGKPKGILGAEGDLALATVCGLVLSGADLEEEGGVRSELPRRIFSRIKRIFRIFIP